MQNNTPETIAEHIKDYLDQKVPLEEIHQGALSQGITEEIWQKSVELVNQSDGKNVPPQKKSKFRGKFKSFAIMTLVFFSGFFIGSYLLHINLTPFLISDSKGLNSYLIRAFQYNLESEVITELYEAEKKDIPISPNNIIQKKKELVERVNNASKNYTKSFHETLDIYSYNHLLILSFKNLPKIPKYLIYDKKAIHIENQAHKFRPNFSSDFYKEIVNENGDLIGDNDSINTEKSLIDNTGEIDL